ncbi:MAG: selenide, water dikinase SelD [Bacteroidota bacterium]|nr:selenide, water dikinase SelD [Bacteroidota bacterium]
MKTIYLDYNATTPIDKDVADAMRPYLDQYFGNPSSSHIYGRDTKKAVENSRKQISGLINCLPSEVLFTSGGTESNNYAIKGIALAQKDKGKHIITTTIEHPAVIEVCKYLEKQAYEISYISVDEFGLVNPKDIEAEIRHDTILISVMHANNEIGSIQPIDEIGEIARKHNVVFHCDAAQSTGKIPVDVIKMKVDLLSVAGHKLYAPKGIGVLYIRDGIKLEKLIHGADHERNLRAGTENVLEIVGLGKACAIAKNNLQKYMQHTKIMRERLHQGLKNSGNEIKLNGHPELRLPNTLNISFKSIEANTLLSELENIAASAGAACHAENVDVSQVIEALVVPIEFAMGTIRFSVGKYTTENDIDEAIGIINSAVERLLPKSEIRINTTEKNEVRDFRLTQFTHGLGCACKLRPQALEEVLKKLPTPMDKRILVGTDNSDDAAVFKLSNEIALVQTLDFFTPIVDDPYQFGAIAAANALSDIYAMGAKPIFGLNIVGFPSNRLPLSVLSDILKGAADKAKEAGIYILGGHSVDDTEPKFGMVVSGIVHPDKIISNDKARPGDVLILTKPIGTGILSTALKRGLIEDETKDRLVENMISLNRISAECMLKFDISACTDVTGFGLLGHLKEVSTAGKVDAVIFAEKVPLLPETRNMAAAGVLPGGTKDNRLYVEHIVNFDATISENMQYILCDAQTSGGLLIAVSEKDSESLLSDLHSSGIKEACIVGKISGKGTGKIVVNK